MFSMHSIFSALLLATSTSAAALRPSACLSPEPSYQICYNDNGATPQNLTLADINAVATYLRGYGASRVRAGQSPFFTMKVKDADNCGEWQVTTKGSVMALAKLVGDQDTAVTFSDIANTIDGGVGASSDDKLASIGTCGSAGGQQGVKINATDSAYKSSEFVNGHFSNSGIVIKLVHKP